MAAVKQETILMTYMDITRENIAGIIFPYNDAEATLIGTDNTLPITLKDYLTPKQGTITLNTGGDTITVNVVKIGNVVYTEGVSGTSTSGLNGSITQYKPMITHKELIKIGGVTSELSISTEGAISCSGTGDFVLPSMSWVVNDGLDLESITIPPQDDDVPVKETTYVVQYYKDNELLYEDYRTTYNLGVGVYIEDVKEVDDAHIRDIDGCRFDYSDPAANESGIIEFPDEGVIIRIYYITVYN